MYVVICAADGDMSDGWYAKRRVFATKAEAGIYAATIAAGRYPRVVTAVEYLTEIKGWRSSPMAFH